MKKLIVILSILLSGCSTVVPVTQKFPDAPEPLFEKCSELIIIDTKNAVSITDLLKTVVKNYELYHECSIRQKAWIEWYNTQRDIFNQGVSSNE